MNGENPLNKKKLLPGQKSADMMKQARLKRKMMGPQLGGQHRIASVGKTQWQAMEAFFEPIELARGVVSVREGGIGKTVGNSGQADRLKESYHRNRGARNVVRINRRKPGWSTGKKLAVGAGGAAAIGGIAGGIMAMRKKKREEQGNI